MAAVTICSDFGAQESKVSQCFHCFPIYLPWSDWTGCHNLSFISNNAFHLVIDNKVLLSLFYQWGNPYMQPPSPYMQPTKLAKHTCHGLNWVPPKFSCWCLNLNMTVFGDSFFKEINKARWGHKGGCLIQQDWCPYKMRKRARGMYVHRKKICENTASRRPSASHGERAHQKPPLLAAWSWASSH